MILRILAECAVATGLWFFIADAVRYRSLIGGTVATAACGALGYMVATIP